MSELSVQEKAANKWRDSYAKATQSDSWGQIVEAVESYDKTSMMIRSEVDALEPMAEDRTALNKIVLSIRLRVKKLTATTDIPGPTVDQMQRVLPVFRDLFSDVEVRFPFDLSEFGAVGTELRFEEVKRDDDDDGEAGAGGGGSTRGGTLLPMPTLIAGHPILAVDIEKIGLKDADTYVEPYMTVSVYDRAGSQICPSQDTPIASTREDRHVVFNERVYIPMPLDRLTETDAALIFEFKHFKPRGKYVSVRCWSLMEMDEIKEGPAILEIYKKPADPRRKKINLHSVKPLYLHVRLSIHSV